MLEIHTSPFAQQNQFRLESPLGEPAMLLRLAGGYQNQFELFCGNALLTIDAITQAAGFGTDRPRDLEHEARIEALMREHD